eukprot:6091923-Pyramimonas_sp.AAC.1
MTHVARAPTYDCMEKTGIACCALFDVWVDLSEPFVRLVHFYINKEDAAIFSDELSRRKGDNHI